MSEDRVDRQLDYLADRLTAVEGRVPTPADIRAQVALGVQDGIKALAADPSFGEAFWRRGFEQLSTHATAASSQWIGKRIMTAFVIAAVSAGIAWLVKTGKV